MVAGRQGSAAGDAGFHRNGTGQVEVVGRDFADMFEDRRELVVGAVAINRDAGDELVDARRDAAFGIEEAAKIECAFGVDRKVREVDALGCRRRDEAD